ncbi:MAG TPA: DUF3106 domain-containing protein [Burkholderiaceae bacterium]|nr:DUF3106 domain-containing protein [Burkholderiaceae bacterium]
MRQRRPHRFLAAFLAALTACALAAPGTHAAGASRAASALVRAEGPSWSSLTAAQRSALAPLEREWPSIDGGRKEKWLEIAAHFPSMPPEERTRIQTRMTEWARLTPKERGEARLNYQEARQLSPAERKARWEQYQALPPEQKRQLAERAEPPTPVRRDAARPAGAASTPLPKSNLVTPTPPVNARVKPVAPTVVQASPGATTTLMSKPPTPPLHQQPGLPKVAATPGFVDRSTLLPQRGAQAAATRAPPSAASAPASARR